MTITRKLGVISCHVLGSLGLLLLVCASSFAQDTEDMSCSELWYKRNEIYARNGYCFNTARARSVFGRGCFPPYGHLSGWEKDRVNEIQYWEAQNGC